MNRTRWLLLCLTVLLLGLLVWFWSSSGSEPPSAILAVEHRPVIRPPASYARALPPLALEEPEEAETDAPTEAAIEREAVEAVWPDSATVRCPASGLEPGLLTARPTPDSAGGTVKFATFDAGSVFAVVSGETGEALLESFFVPEARLIWSNAAPGSEGQCRVVPLRVIQVRGRVVDFDGSAAADVDVRGCIKGDVQVTDETGAFTIDAVEGMPCHPMAFLDRDGVFARSDAPLVEPVDGAPAEVLLTLERGWSPEQQLALMDQMAQLMSQQASQMTAQNPAADAAQRAEDPAVAQQLQAWGQVQQDQNNAIWDDLGALLQDEDPYIAFRQLWLNTH